MTNYFTSLIIIVTFINSGITFGQDSTLTIRNVPLYRNPDYITTKGTSGKEVNLDKWVDQVSKDIVRARPGAFTPQPEDKVVIRSAYESLKKQMSMLGFNSTSTLKALFAAWIELSIKSYDKTLKETEFSEQDLVDEAIHSGVLNIETKPEGAIVRIDGYECCGKTTTEVWTREGEHKLEIIKDGFFSIYEIIEVQPHKEITVQRSLRPKTK